MKEHILYKAAIILSVLLFVCLGVTYYIHPLPSHDGVWTLTPVFSDLQGHYTDDIFTGYRLPFLYYFLKLPFYFLLQNNIYGPFIFNLIINILYVFIIVNFSKKYQVHKIQTWLAITLFLSCNVFLSLRPEHLINLFLLYYYFNHSAIKKNITHMVIVWCFLFIHPAAGLFALLFHVFQFPFSAKNILIQLGGLVLVFMGVYCFQPQLVATIYESLQARYNGGLFQSLYSFGKSCLFINIYYLYRLFLGNTFRKDILQWLAFVLLALLIGKDYYFDYVVVYTLYKCITLTQGEKKLHYFTASFAIASFSLFPLKHLVTEIDDYAQHSNLKEVLYKIEAVVSENPDKTYQVPMEFGLSAMRCSNVRLMYHDLEADVYKPLVYDSAASILVPDVNKIDSTSQKSKNQVYQWVRGNGQQKYGLFEIQPLSH